MNEDLIKLLSRFFLQCSQLACIEEANRTMDFLCQMERLFRYWTRADTMYDNTTDYRKLNTTWL